MRQRGQRQRGAAMRRSRHARVPACTQQDARAQRARAAEALGQRVSELRIVSIHLGNGASALLAEAADATHATEQRERVRVVHTPGA